VTTSSPISEPGRGQSARWRDKLATVITVLLLMSVAGHMFFVVPSYRRLLQSLGVVPSLPSRVAIATSKLGLLLFAVAFLGTGIAYWQQRKDRTRLVPGVLSIAALLSVLYLALVACVYWDVARVMERIH
jgi:hypothetical protein